MLPGRTAKQKKLRPQSDFHHGAGGALIMNQ